MLRADPTRYLSAAAYADPGFAESVLSGVLWKPTNIVAPCRGVEVAVVVRHCLKARRRHLGFTLTIAAQPLLWVVLAQLLLLGRVGLLASAVGLAGTIVVPVAVRRYLPRAKDQRERRSRPTRPRTAGRQATSRKVLAGAAALLLLKFLLVGVVTLVGTFLSVALLLAANHWAVRGSLARRLLDEAEAEPPAPPGDPRTGERQRHRLPPGQAG